MKRLFATLSRMFTREFLRFSLVLLLGALGDRVRAACAPLPEGLVGWWRAEGDRQDHQENGDGAEASGLSFVPGFVGQAFRFEGGAPGVLVGNPTAFQLQDFTIETWLRRADPFSTSENPGYGGAIFAGGLGSYSLAMEATGEILISEVGVTKALSIGRITDTQWHHVAVTKSGSVVNFYLDGAPAGSVQYVATFVFGTPFAIGSLGTTIGYNYTYWGEIDELSLYQRALTAAEVAVIFVAGSDGKCIVPPENLTLSVRSPANAVPGSDFTVTFQVANQGTNSATEVILAMPLPAGFTLVTNTSTQGSAIAVENSLRFLLGSLPGGSQATVTLTGHGAVPTVLSFLGRLTRAEPDQSLIDNQVEARVEILGPCISLPNGLLVSLRGEGDAQDLLQHTTTFVESSYTPGRVGQAFVFNGTGEIALLDSPDLNPATFTLETWIHPTRVDGTVDIIASKETFPDASEKIQFELGIKGPLNDAPNTIPERNLAFFLSGISGLPNNYGGWTDTQVAIPMNQWTHVALTVQPGTVTAYVNGALAFQKTGLTGSPVVNQGPLRLGARDSHYVTHIRPQDRFNGFIDEFSFYGRALAGTEIASIYQAGGAGKCVEVIAPKVVVAPADETVLAGRDAIFRVVAVGTGPLLYQWQFNDVDIPGATNATWIVVAPRRVAGGKYGVTVCNAADCTPQTSATLTITPAPVQVMMPTVSAKSPRDVQVPIRLIGNGIENAVSFSLRFDTNRMTFEDVELGADALGGQLLINSAQAANGVVGVILALPAGSTFADGTNEVLSLRFATTLANFSRATALMFWDNPTVRKVADNTGKALPGIFNSTSIQIAAADFEGDLSPVPAGDHRVDISDWVQVGRIVAGLDDFSNAAQFQRADAAPLSTSGNGLLTVSDWVQAGRFAVGLDPLKPAGGPTESGGMGAAMHNGAKPQAGGPRRVSLADGSLVFGRTNEISILLAAEGDENAVAFSLSFDATGLMFLGARLAVPMSGAAFNVNTRQAHAGRLGIALALSTGKKFAVGTREIARLSFVVVKPGLSAESLVFGDAPVVREVANATAEALASTWQNPSLTLLLPRIVVDRIQTADGSAVALSWPAQFNGGLLQSAGTPDARTWTAVTVAPVLTNDVNTVIVPFRDAETYFRLYLP